MMTKRENRVACLLASFLLVFFSVSSAFAHSIDYTAYDIQPETIFDGQSGHFRLKDPIAPGSTITFNLTLELIESAGGGTSTLPVTVTFGVKNTGGGYDPANVYFGTPATSLSHTIVHKYEKISGKISALMTPVTAYAPEVAGSYHFKIQAIDGYKGNGFTPGEGIVVHFKVAGDTSEPAETELRVDLGASNILYRSPENTLYATLTEKETGAPITGQPIDFYVNGSRLELDPSAVTDGDGVVAISYPTATLPVGDHTVAANYGGAEGYTASSGSATQCVTYKWLGYQPPVLVQQDVTSGLGIGLFQGKVIPVKVKIADYYGAAVINAEARVYFAKTVAGAAEEQAVAIQPTIADDGSLMRYDSTADQYILNWNIVNLVNGDYNIRVGMNEGECASGHWVPVRIGKASK